MQHIQHGRPGREGARLDRVRLNETITDAVFGGRRRRVYARITALSGARPGYRVLDIGCGGYLARLLAAAVGPGGRVTGVDPSAKAVRYAQRRSSANCSFRVGVAQDLGLPDRSFDVVTRTLAAHHIPEAVRAAAFGEILQVLRPGGVLLQVEQLIARRQQRSPRQWQGPVTGGTAPARATRWGCWWRPGTPTAAR